jgi:hypothetical protein
MPGKSGGTKLSRPEASDEAGMSKRQAITAIRVANVPEEEFERLVESDSPLTVTALAELGEQPRPKLPIVDLGSITPQE